ncbi:paxillin [Trichuris trichiura]|uniref:Paxillin n=1 Tax=Trichuris trichiura TaxID=36087 RepID=A0A077Z788_TRITR|nr:paxillin [Trichuris trichiura]
MDNSADMTLLPYPPNCAKCAMPIDAADAILAAGKIYHVNHFQCILCASHINSGGHFYVRNEDAYCDECYTALYLRRCYACKKPLNNTAIVALGNKWHEDCFHCKTCSKPFEDKCFVLFDEAYCREHYWQARGNYAI